MKIIGGCQTKPEIDYPCQWLFKVIGSGCQEVEAAIKEVVGDASFKITPSKASSGGKYHSVNLEMEVTSEEYRLAIYRNLGACASIKVVL
ncbi:MAG: DUF493 domain-containing protein [Desulfobulbaceae bacterium]|nr:DUF493 domain-containing protein [Desulfobulbaceae bacterium]